MAKKKHKKVPVPRPKGRGTASKGQSQTYVALLAAFQRVKLFLSRHRVVVRGILIFTGGILGFMLIHSRMVQAEALDGLLRFTARATGAIVNLFGASAEVEGTLISSSSFSMIIVTECTALVPTAIVVCAVLAYPGTWRQKAIGAGLGIAALFVLNLVRTSSLFFIGGSFSSSFFNTAHFLIWQPLMIVIAVALWLLWVEKLVRVVPH